MAEILRRAAILALVSVAFFSMAFASPTLTGMITSSTGGTSKLVVWDETDNYYNGPQSKKTYPTTYAAYKPYCFMGKDFEDPDDYPKWDTHFFANYTNSTQDPLTSSDGSCDIRFDSNNDSTYEAWTAMSYNGSSFLWEYNRSFTYKGILPFQVNCTSTTYDNFVLTDNVTLDDTGPCLFEFDLPSVSCYEEDSCSYDFSQNVSDDDANDVLVYNVLSGSFSGFSIDSGTGQWTVLVQNVSDTQTHTINLQANDSDGLATTSVFQNITILPINDPPYFSTLPSEATEDSEFNTGSHPESVITATDEEDNTPFTFSLTFMSCLKAPWVADRTSNCTLFNYTSGADNLTIDSFTPTNWDVGQYQINFTVEDSGSLYSQFSTNSSNSTIVWFTVENVNDPPNVTSYNGTSSTFDQGNHLYLRFNGTDIENDTLTFNVTTLYQNLTDFENTTLFSIDTNTTYYPNESAYGTIDLVLGNSHVGNYTLNVTVTDNGTSPDNLTGYMLFNLTILNVNDPPEIINLSTTLPYAVEEKHYYHYVYVDDPDLSTPYGDNITFGLFFLNCSTPLGEECTLESNSTFNITKINDTLGLLHVFALRNDTGNYTLNITVTDSGGLVNWTVANLSIIEDDPPVIYAASELTMTQNQTFVYYFNISDPQNDTLTMTNATLYMNLTAHALNLFPVSVNSSAYPPLYNLTMNYTNVTNAQVGYYILEINATDIWNLTTTRLINLTVANINDPPQITGFVSCDGSESYPIDLPAYENTWYCVMPEEPDPDLLVPKGTYWENLTYSMALENCTSSTDYYPTGNCSGTAQITMNSSTGVVNFTATDETWHGNYTFNLTIQDSVGETASRIIVIEVHPVNDPPELVGLPEIINITAEIAFTYQINATDEENNTPFFYNASFTCDGLPCALFTINWTNGSVNFTAQMSDVGNYTANFTVTDNGNTTFGYPNATGWQLVNITVAKQYHPPVIEYLYPVSSYTMTEGTTKNFLYKANDTIDNDTLTCYWYINGSLIIPDSTLSVETENPVDNCNTTESSALWQYGVTYDDALNLTSSNVTITLIVMDPQGFTANASVNMTVLSGNRAPRFNQSITSPIKWYNRMSITPLDLDDHFVDDYGETLNYSYIGGENVVISIDGSMVTLTPVGDWVGTSWAVFVANDSEYNATSNNVTLIVQYQPPEEVPKPVTKYTFKPRVASLQVIVDEIVKVGLGSMSRAKVILHNDGGYDLEGITLNASINETNITLRLADDFIDRINVGENATTWLDITMGELDVNKTYLAVITASVTNPSIKESAVITIKPEPTNKTKAMTEIVMVKDLFEENPECMELFGLITQAEEYLDNGDIAEARRLTQLAMDNCQDMIDYSKLPKGESTGGQPSVSGQVFMNPFFVMGFVIAVLALAMLGYWAMSRRQQVAAIPKTIPKE